MRTNLMATQKFHEATGKMTHLCRKIIHVNINRRGFVEKVSVVRNFLSFIWDKILVCSIRINNRNIHRSPPRYRRLSTRRNGYSNSTKKIDDDGDGVIEFSCSSTATKTSEEEDNNCPTASRSHCYDENDSDLVSLKISILGDCKIGKTSFVIKYVGDEQERKSLQMKGLNLMDKTLDVKGARITFNIWDVGGDRRSLDQVPIACKDAVAILFMFDLTSRCTLNGIIRWYSEAKKWNQSAIPILIGTKFDDFVQLPPDMQWTVITQARAYARAMKATLFFSSATHNINVNKIFKFIMAKLFNLPWDVKRNLTVGEPIIDF